MTSGRPSPLRSSTMAPPESETASRPTRAATSSKRGSSPDPPTAVSGNRYSGGTLSGQVPAVIAARFRAQRARRSSGRSCRSDRCQPIAAFRAARAESETGTGSPEGTAGQHGERSSAGSTVPAAGPEAGHTSSAPRRRKAIPMSSSMERRKPGNGSAGIPSSVWSTKMSCSRAGWVCPAFRSSRAAFAARTSISAPSGEGGRSVRYRRRAVLSCSSSSGSAESASASRRAAMSRVPSVRPPGPAAGSPQPVSSATASRAVATIRRLHAQAAASPPFTSLRPFSV